MLNSVVCQHGRERAWVFEVLGIWRKGQGTGHGGSLVGGRTRFDKDPGKEEKLQSSLWILGDVRVLPVTFMESSLTVCEEKIPVREEENPVVSNVDRRCQYELGIFLKKTSLKE